jgi:hypothetical protein
MALAYIGTSFNSYQLSVISYQLSVSSAGFKSPTNWTESVGGGFKSPTIRLVTVYCSLFTVLRIPWHDRRGVRQKNIEPIFQKLKFSYLAKIPDFLKKSGILLFTNDLGLLYFEF